MAFDKDQVFDYIETADSWINLNDALGEINIRGLTEPLINSINEEGGVSYVLGSQKRYRASTTATVLDALADVNLLPSDAIHQMQDHLYKLRDSFTPLEKEDDKISKDSEDKMAWGIDEAPSVWTTSKVLIALITTQYSRRDDFTHKQRTDLRDSVYWLAEQAYDDGGWGYQHYENSPACKSSVPMTALAMRAIFLAQKDDSIFNADARKASRFHKIKNALSKGKRYLLNHKVENTQRMENGDEKQTVHWEYAGKAGVAISIWALDALKLLTTDKMYWQLEEEYPILERKVLNFIYDNLPDQDNLDTYCQSELFFTANADEGVKYKPYLARDKKFYTFIPYVVSSLLDRGENPYNPKIITMIRWLLNNREQHWAIQEYNTAAPCSISAAMAINVIVKWLKKVSQTTFSNSVINLLRDTINERICPYGLNCDRPDPAKHTKKVKTFMKPLGIVFCVLVVLKLLFPMRTEILMALFAVMALGAALLINTLPFEKVIAKAYEKRKSILWEIFIGVIMMVVTWGIGLVLFLLEHMFAVVSA